MRLAGFELPLNVIASLLLAAAAIFSGGCGNAPKKEVKTYQSGEKAQSGPLYYSVIDTQVQPSLADGSRTPRNRFYLVQVSVFNSGNQPVSIPSFTLVDDSGQAYNELADGQGIANWMGVLRKLPPAQTQQGMIAFDAPAKHYRLKITDDLDDTQVYLDLPLHFLHDGVGGGAMASDASSAPQPPAAKQ